jgi:hypothetical protein
VNSRAAAESSAVAVCFLKAENGSSEARKIPRFHFTPLLKEPTIASDPPAKRLRPLHFAAITAIRRTP